MPPDPREAGQRGGTGDTLQVIDTPGLPGGPEGGGGERRSLGVMAEGHSQTRRHNRASTGRTVEQAHDKHRS
jgi:hypothetical protein